MKIYNFFFLFFLASCSTIDTNRIAPAYVEAFISIKQSITGIENTINPDLISNIPYASMTVKIGKGPTGLKILEEISEEGYVWVSADGVFLVINIGKIINSFGLNNNLHVIL